MADISRLVAAIKEIDRVTQASSFPAHVQYGTVLSMEPLQIRVSDKLILTKEFLVLSSLVQDFTVDMTMKVEAEDTRQSIQVHLGLQTGEKVILIREQGGQQYLVLDRVR